MKLSSFINERTSELVLVPSLIRIFTARYKHVTPIFYWVTREGSSVARRTFPDKLLRMLVIYPRRPKIYEKDSTKVYVKLNQLLYDRSRLYLQKGIPVIAGFPLCNSMASFHSNVPCLWIELSADGSESILEVDFLTQQIRPAVTTLNEAAILDLAENKAIDMSWEQLQQIIEEVRREARQSDFSWYRVSGDLYKPIYLLLHLD